MKRVAIIGAFALGCALSAPGTFAHAHQSGSSGASTAAKKPVSKKRHHYSRRQPMQKAPTSDRISEIQSALASNGYYHGDPNGKWDSNTISAMQKFQSDHGLDANGKLDARSLQRLGLGSDIAGVSAPRPSPPGATAPPPAAPKSQPSSAGAAAGATSASLAQPKTPQQ